MEFVDEEPKPRFFLQSSSVNSSLSSIDPCNRNLPAIFFSIFVAILISIGAFFLIESQTIHFFLAWIVCSLIIGPFAPSSYTGGSISVGRGPIVQFSDPDCDLTHEESRNVNLRRQKHRRSDDFGTHSVTTSNYVNLRNTGGDNRDGKVIDNGIVDRSGEKEGEWDDADAELLKKQIMKHPTGTPNRWETIAEAFGGRYKIDRIIKKSKDLIKKPVTEDPYTVFLKNRKPVDRRIDGEKPEIGEIEMVTKWSSVEDISLLNAMKSFPKSVALRWEKVSEAVPGRSKSDCMKRVAELKRDFRNVKVSPGM